MTPHDKVHVREVLAQLRKRDCAGCCDCTAPEEVDCFDSEVVMLSSGYAEVRADGEVGEVIQHGNVIWTEDEDAQVENA